MLIIGSWLKCDDEVTRPVVRVSVQAADGQPVPAGRDVLDHMDVILSRRRNEVLLLAPPHQYHVTPP